MLEYLTLVHIWMFYEETKWFKRLYMTRLLFPRGRSFSTFSSASSMTFIFGAIASQVKKANSKPNTRSIANTMSLTA